ncbi:D-amino acid aminotransferase [Marichromatium bheemlicum]|uniref:D-amino acid aminotransferase n=1 Tax=Marichromatium bheemlicum TaxID=365339 RepID=A0ABX1I8S6_9GAMM|nr:D-amino acid aminotransferase [Marichromatium bheemlicum]NKN32622.1 D-amino acid aminotransferase [Marichromatium bheemlicum]
MKEIYLNGRFLPPEAAQVSVLDRGFLFGDGVYEVVPSYGGHFLGLDRHLSRLEHSLAAIGLGDPLGREGWQRVARRLAGEPPAPDQSLYLQITRGVAPTRDHRCPAVPSPTVLAMSTPLAPRDPAIARDGIRCITRPDIRWQRCDIKSTSLLGAVLMRQAAADAGADETIMVRDGRVTEAAAANVFVVQGQRLLTPPCDHHLLAGITRELVLQLAAHGAIAYSEQPIEDTQLRTADEIWLGSSTRELLPVTRLDGLPVGSGRPGPLWQRMDALYQDYKSQVRNGHVQF